MPKMWVNNFDWVQKCSRCGNPLSTPKISSQATDRPVSAKKVSQEDMTPRKKQEIVSKTIVSAIVTGFPRELQQPKLRPREALVQFVVRNYSAEWRNFVDTMNNQFNVPKAICEKLLRCDFSEVATTTLQNEITNFINSHIPNHGRTIRGLSGLRELLTRPTFREMYSFELIEIIWPRENDPTGILSDQRFAEPLGAKVIPMPASSDKTLNLTFLVQQIKGEFLWLIPGGTRIWVPDVITQLTRIFNFLTLSLQYALYFDGTYSTIYRASALKHLISQGKKLSADQRENGITLRTVGYEITADNNPSASLCHLEEIYGGKDKL